MKTNLFKSLTLAIGMLASVTSATADEITATLVHTAGTRFGKAATEKNTVDGENEYYNKDDSRKDYYVGYAFAEFSFTIPEGETISKAELTWTAKNNGRATNSYDNKIYYLNANTKLDYDKIASTQDNYRFSNEKTYIDHTNFKKTKTSTTDVTDAVKAISTAGQDYIIFQWTGNDGSAYLAGKGSTTNAPVLKITTVSASSATKYTIKYVDESGKDIKNAEEYDGVIGQNFTASTEDMAAIYTSDKKYIYASGNETKVAVKEAASNIITLKFREAAKWNYTFKAVDKEGNPLQEGIVKGTNFEGETFNVGYPYVINVNGTLYTSGKLSSDGKGYYLSYTLKADNQVKDITFKPTTTTDIVFLSEAENIEGLTKATNNNTFVRSSNGGSAYAAEADVEITKLQPGKYKLIAVICDATKNAGSEWNFLAGENNIFKFKVNKSSNWTQGTSEEFEVNAETPIFLAKGGSANQAVDFIYIQRTGDATETVSVSDAGYATYATTNNVVVPNDENVKVMTVKVNAEGTAIELNEVKAGTVIPGNTGFLVKAAAGKHDFVVTSDKGETLANNDLKAATEDVTSADDKFFALTKLGEKVGFALVEKDVVIPAGKAYLEVSKGTAAKFFSLDGEATGINSVKTAKADGAYYTLEGVKTTKPVKGLYIHNGKKIIVK